MRFQQGQIAFAATGSIELFSLDSSLRDRDAEGADGDQKLTREVAALGAHHHLKQGIL